MSVGVIAVNRVPEVVRAASESLKNEAGPGTLGTSAGGNGAPPTNGTG